MLHKLVILASYVFLLSLFLRWIDWCETLIGSSHGLSVEPSRLGVQRLKAILEYRGVLYDSIFEKEHLVNLVESSGRLNQQDINDAASVADSYINSNQSHSDTVGTFTSLAHFYEQVEDSKDTGWIVKIVVPHSISAISADLWLKLINKFRRFDLKFGIFDCGSFKEFCHDRGWNSTRLLLSLPFISRAKHFVALKTFTNSFELSEVILRQKSQNRFDYTTAKEYHHHPVELQHVVHKWGHLERWLYQQLAQKVSQLRTPTELSNWLTNSCAADVCLLLVSSLTLPPVLLSALSVKFTGRIRFGLASARTVDESLTNISNTEEDNTDETTVRNTNGRRWGNYSRNGQLLVFGPSNFARQNLTRILLVRRPIRYGNIAGERLSLKSLSAWLRCLTPDINDIFVFSLALVNLLAGVAVLQNLPRDLRLINSGGQVSLWAVSNPFLKLAIVFAKYNFLLLLGWLLILSASRFAVLGYFGRQILVCMREFSMSALGRATIGGFQRLCSNGVIWLLTSFVVVNGAIQYFTHRISRSTDRSSHSNNNNPENESPTDHHDSDNETFTNWLTSYSRRNPSVSIANLLAMSQPVTNPLDVVFRQGRNFRGVFSSGSSDDGNETDTNGNGVQIDEVQHRRILSLLSHLEIGANFLYLRPESISYDYVFDLPVFKFHKNSSECLNGQQKMGTSESCAICLDEYEPEEELCNLPCAHGYHRRCIVAWLFRDQPVCPVCRWPAYKQKF